MKSLLHKIIPVPFLGVLFISLAASQIMVLPLKADELTNISDIKGCRAIEGEAERLLCYDTVSGGGIFNEQQLKQVQVEKFGSEKMPKSPDPEPAPATSTIVGKGTVMGTSTSEGDQQAPATGKSISVNSLNVTVVRVKKDNRGIYYFQTADRQVWKQQEPGSWSLTVPFDAKIKKGVLGSFFLVNEGGKSTRVKRVK